MCNAIADCGILRYGDFFPGKSQGPAISNHDIKHFSISYPPGQSKNLNISQSAISLDLLR